MQYMPANEDERRERAFAWVVADLKAANRRYWDHEPTPPIPPTHQLIPNPYGEGGLIVPINPETITFVPLEYPVHE